MRRLRWPLALLLSCSVYLVPFVGPHMVQFLGEWLTRVVTRGDRPWPWLAAEIASVVVLQAIAFVTWYWILGRPRSARPLVLVVLVPLSVVAMNWLFMIALPTRFLIDPDEAPDQATWPVACTVPDESLVFVGRRSAIVAPGGESAFVQNAHRIERLSITESAADGRVTCGVSPIGSGPLGANVSPVWIGDRGQILLTANSALSWEWVAGPGAAPVPLVSPVPGGLGGAAPVVARNGAAVAWLVPVVGSGQPPSSQVLVQTIASATAPRDGASRPTIDITVPLDRLDRGSFVVLELDTEAREVMLSIDERKFVAVGFDGAIRWGPLRPDGVDPLSMTFRRLDPGWVAWDGYKENDGYVIAWSLPIGTGAHRVPRGRGVTDVAVHPAGRLVALSVSTTLSIGSVRDTVTVLNVADGREVFRRTLPRYARSAVAFPTPTLFAYSEWDGTRAEVRVLRIPAELSR